MKSQTKPRFSLIVDATLQRRSASGEAADQPGNGTANDAAAPAWPQANQTALKKSRFESDRLVATSSESLNLHSVVYSFATDSRTSSQTMEAELRRSANFCRVGPSSWLIAGEENAEQLTQRLNHLLGPQDTLLVAEIAGEVNGWSSRYVWAWLAEVRARSDLHGFEPNSMAPSPLGTFANGSSKAKTLYPKKPVAQQRVKYVAAAQANQ